MDCELSEEFSVIFFYALRICVVTFIFAVVVDVYTHLSRNGVLSELLFADDLIFMNVTIEGLWTLFRGWMEAFESKGLKINVK